MAKIRYGKRKGETVEIHQFCNDWVTDDKGKVYGITSLEFTDAEIEELKEKDTGVMFDRFELIGNHFKRKTLSFVAGK